MSQWLLDEASYSGLRRCVGARVNLFRAMHSHDVFVDEELSVVALRDGDYALAARVVFDVVFDYFYVSACHWYRSDLSRLPDQDVPEGVRHDLLQRFFAFLG